jgi:hypothetical protein
VSLPPIGPLRYSLPAGWWPDAAVAFVVRLVAAVTVVVAVVVALFLKSLLAGVAYISRLAMLADPHSDRRLHGDPSHVTHSLACPVFTMRHSVHKNHVTHLITYNTVGKQGLK